MEVGFVDERTPGKTSINAHSSATLGHSGRGQGHRVWRLPLALQGVRKAFLLFFFQYIHI